MLSKSWSSIFREDIDTTARLLEAYLCVVKSMEEFIFGRWLFKKRGSAIVGFAWSVLCVQDMRETRGNSVRCWLFSWAFSLLRLSLVLQYLQNKHQRTPKPCFGFVLFGIFLGKRKWDCSLIWFLITVFSAGGDTGVLLLVNSGKNSLLASWLLYDIIKDITTLNNCH